MAVLQIPKLQKNDTYETVIAIANEHGESSISLLYQDLKQEKVLAGYVEGGNSGYSGTIIVRFLKDGEINVQVNENPFSIL